MFEKFLRRRSEGADPEGDLPVPPDNIPAADLPAPGSPPAPSPDDASTGFGRKRVTGIAGLSVREQGSDETRKPRVVQNNVNDSVYQERSEHVQRIEAVFSEYGPRVSSYMLTQSFTTGGVMRVLTKLDIRSRGREGADLALIANWISSHGVEEFGRLVGLRMSGDSDTGTHPAPLPSKKDQPSVRPLGNTGPSDTQTFRVPRSSPSDTGTSGGHSLKQQVSVKPVQLNNEPKKDPPTPPGRDPGSSAFMFSPKKKKDDK